MEEIQNIINGHEAVDLVLSVKWAAYNIGASNPEEYGDYFAFGETEPKDEYTEENYMLYGIPHGGSIYWHWKNNLRNGIRCSKQTMGG